MSAETETTLQPHKTDRPAGFANLSDIADNFFSIDNPPTIGLMFTDTGSSIRESKLSRARKKSHLMFCP